MEFAYKITAGAGFNGTTPLAVGPPPFDTTLPKPGLDGVITVSVPGAIGIIDPDLSVTSGANRSLLLQSFFYTFTGTQNLHIDVIDDTGAAAFDIANLTSVTSPIFREPRRLIPLGYRIRVQAGSTSATLRLNLWSFENAGQLISAAPV